MEVEEVHLLGSSDTLKMSVLDNDETFAMDEFYFCFFSRTREAFTKLQACLNAKSDESAPGKRRHDMPTRESTKFFDSVKDTTTFIRSSSPTPEAMEGGSSSPRRSHDSPRRSLDGDDGEMVEQDPSSPSSSPKRHSFKTAAWKHLGLGRTRSPSPSPLRQSSESFDRLSQPGKSPTIPQQDETSWSDTGKMLWSRGVTAADWMRQRGAQVGSHVLHAGVGKVSQFWSGDNARSEHAKWVTEETAKDMKDQNPEERFQSHFALPPSEKLLASYYGYVFRTFPFYGKMYLSKFHFCFRSLLPGIKTKVRYCCRCS